MTTINHVQNVRADISEMLSKIREVSNKTDVFTQNNNIISEPSSTSDDTKTFTDILSVAKNSLSHVSQFQNESEHLKNAYLTGDNGVSMSQVIVASQKSKLAFEGLLAVRNKILDAYKEIMNMPV